MISILIPVYNEHEAIKFVVEDLISKLKTIDDNYLFEIILINDNSDEQTVQEIKNLNHQSIVRINNIINMGYGYSLKKGIEIAKYDTIMIIDGDGSYPTENFKKLLNIYNQGFDLVVASRGKQFSEDSLVKSIFRKFLRKIVEFSSGTKIPDVNSGMRFFSKATIKNYVHLVSDRFSFTTSMTLLYALDRKLIHFEENGYNKRKGKSKVHLRKDILRTLQIIIEIIALKNPLKLHILLILMNFVVFSIFSLVYFLVNNQFDLIIIHSFLIILFFQMSIASYAVQNKK